MTTTPHKESIETAVMLAREYPDLNPMQISDAMESLRKIARRCQKENERCCNEPTDDADIAKWQKRTARELTDIASIFGIKAHEGSGDPRGVSLFMELPSGKTNDWGQQGWAVPY